MGRTLAPKEVVGTPKNSIRYYYPSLTIGSEREQEGSKGSEREQTGSKGSELGRTLAPKEVVGTAKHSKEVVGTAKHSIIASNREQEEARGEQDPTRWEEGEIPGKHPSSHINGGDHKE